MPKETTYLITGADTLFGYTPTLLLANSPHSFIFALCNSDVGTWRTLHSDNENATPSCIQTLHIDSFCSLDRAADIIAQKHGKRIDVVIACPDSNIDARGVVSSMGGVLQAETKLMVCQTLEQPWCKDFMKPMHQRSKVVSLCVEIGGFGAKEMKTRAAWVLYVTDMLTKKKGSGGVVCWDR